MPSALAQPAPAAAPTDEATAEIAAAPLADRIPEVGDWLPSAVLPLWEAVADYPIFGALIIAIVFWALAFLIRLVVFPILHRLTGLSRSSVDDQILKDLGKPVFTTTLYLGLVLATQAARLPAGTGIIVNLFLSVIVASWMRATLLISGSFLASLERSPRFTLVEPRTIPLFDLSIKLLTILFGSYALLIVWGINPVGWLASAGIVGIAVGFAAKDTLANLFAGFFIVADAPYRIGDYINLDSGERGKVSGIGLRSTRLITRDDVEITIPNGVIANAKIVNESGGLDTKMRARIAVGVAYGSDVDRVVQILQKIGEDHAQTCADPAPRVRMRKFGASSLDFDLLVWIANPEDRGRIGHELYMEIYRTFAREGIEIPYAKLDLFIKQSGPGPASEG